MPALRLGASARRPGTSARYDHQAPAVPHGGGRAHFATSSGTPPASADNLAAKPRLLAPPDPAALTSPPLISSAWPVVNRNTAQRYAAIGLGERSRGSTKFAWNEVCDWTIELLKRRPQSRPAIGKGAALSLKASRSARSAQVLAKCSPS